MLVSVGYMDPLLPQISLLGTCSKRCSRRIFAFSSGVYRLRALLLMLLFLGRGKVAYLKTLKRTFQPEAEQTHCPRTPCRRLVVSLHDLVHWFLKKCSPTFALSAYTFC
jgi:hypothetical protein